MKFLKNISFWKSWGATAPQPPNWRHCLNLNSNPTILVKILTPNDTITWSTPPHLIFDNSSTDSKHNCSHMIDCDIHVISS